MSGRVSALAWFLLFILTLIWGSSFILMKQGLVHFSPVLVALLRQSVATVFLLPLAIWSFRKIDRKDWLKFAVSSFIGVGLPAILFPLAQKGVSSSVAGIGNSLSPFWVLVLGALFFRKRFTGLKVVGVLVGFAGAVLLVLGNQDKSGSTNFGYASLLVVATFCYGLSTNIMRDLLTRYPAPVATAFQVSMFGLPALICLFPATDFLQVMQTHDGAWKSFAAVVTLGALGTALSVLLFSRLIQLTDAVFSSSVTYLMPIVAVIWGLIDGESVHWMQFAGMAVILSGVYLVNRGK